MKLRDSEVIDCPKDTLYRLLSDIERHPRILPEYRQSRILSRQNGTFIVEREAVIEGQLRQWTSEIALEEGQALYFRHLAGPLPGMKVEWRLKDEGQKTRLEISHDIAVRPWWKKWWMENVVIKPMIQRAARACLMAIRSAADARMPL